MNVKILDCTLRDGGYYTNWDFDKSLVDKYLNFTNKLPISYLEIGYKSNQINNYSGEYFYLPLSTIKYIKDRTKKKIALMINAKDKINTDILSNLKPYVSLIRIATSPEEIQSNLKVAIKLKELGFEVAMNVMYISKVGDSPFYDCLDGIEKILNYLYMVDSYGSIYPDELKKIIKKIRLKTNVKLGFHGHNNIELAFSNSLAAIENGVELIDCTVLGMGRGAGNLKTELLLTYLKSCVGIDVDLNALGGLTEAFQPLLEKYKWGVNLAYMVSGSYSMPQNLVMQALEIDRYSLTGIVNQLKSNERATFPRLKSSGKIDKCMVIGGGNSVTKHLSAIKEYLQLNVNDLIIHSSSKHIKLFEGVTNTQFFAIAGEEILKINSNLKYIDAYVLGPSPRKINLEINNSNNFFELEGSNFPGNYTDSPLSISLVTALELEVGEVNLIGFDGYNELKNKKQLYLMQENQNVIDAFLVNDDIISLTPTMYRNIKQGSIYNMIDL